VTRLLLIAEDTQAQPLAVALASTAELQVRCRARLAEARVALEAGAFDAILYAPAQADPEAVRQTEEIRAAAPRPLLVVLLPAATSDPVSFAGTEADLIVTAPVDLAALGATIERLSTRPNPPPNGGSGNPFPPATPPAPDAALAAALEVLRDFSQVLGYSLDYRQLTQQFVSKLREVIGVARIAIFLEPPETGPATQGGATPGREANRLIWTAGGGLPRELLECLELTRLGGIGAQVTRSGQVLRAGDSEANQPGDQKIQREFEILRCQVALPINDRERTIGVALLGGRVTGGAFTDAELRLVYHLLEELGLAVKNSWLHDQLAASHQLFGGVLEALTSGSLVVGSDLAVLHANRAFMAFLHGGDARAGTRVEFAGLPPPLAAALHELVEKNRRVEPFFLSAEKGPGAVHRITLVPFPNPAGRLPQPALAIVEDFTQIQAAQRAEIESSNARLIALIAKRFAHEIRNALVPLTTHHQLIDENHGDPEFRASLKMALGRETGRIQRFTEQMLFLSQPPGPAADLVPVAALLAESCRRAAETLGVEGQVEIEGGGSAAQVRGHRPSLVHALEEIFMNCLQAAPGSPIRVRVGSEHPAFGPARLSLGFRDAGPGLAPAVAARAVEPFFTTRNTGVGLGLTVARRIVEQHAGHLKVLTRAGPNDPDVLLDLPLP
jgi:signal transduction histidine kinase